MRLDGPLQNDDWESSAVFRSMRQEHRVTASRELRTTSERALGHLAVMRTKILDDAFVETTGSTRTLFRVVTIAALRLLATCAKIKVSPAREASCGVDDPAFRFHSVPLCKR